MDTHIIYATNVANADLYPDNIPSSFSNRLYKELNLNPKRAYEMCLQKLLLPTSHYVIMKDDLESYVRVGLICTNVQMTGFKHTYSKFLLKNNILAGSIKEINNAINNEIANILSSKELSFIDKAYKKLYPKYGTTYIKYDSSYNRNKFSAVYSDAIMSQFQRPGEEVYNMVCRISLSFGRAIGKVIGTETGEDYVIYLIRGIKYETGKETDLCVYPPQPRGMMDNLCIYCDKIMPTCYGDQLVNILDVVSLNGSDGGNKKLYKPLNTSIVDSVSITMTDQEGNPVYFDARGCTIAVLHIRPTLGVI